MAISEPHYTAIANLHYRGELTQGGTILEIGQANYYTDMPLNQLAGDIRTLANGRCTELLARLDAAAAGPDLFELAKLVYEIYWQPTEVRAIDLNGLDSERLDLNAPCQLGARFDTVINHGTAEHVFNIANVFKVAHDHCKVGGLMIHEAPFTGWIDHGFYCLQPTLFYDLAAANGYNIRAVIIEHIETKLAIEVDNRETIHQLAAEGKLPNNAMLYVAMRKMAGGEFRVPMQGYYNQKLSPAGNQAWQALR